MKPGILSSFTPPVVPSLLTTAPPRSYSSPIQAFASFTRPRN